MSVYKGRDGLWVATTELNRDRHGTRKRLVRKAKTRSRAIEKLKAAENQNLQSGCASDARLTLAAFAETYFNDLLPGRVKESTAVGYRNIMNYYVLPYLGKRPLTELRPNHVVEMLRRLDEDGFSANTRMRARAQLRAVLTKAEQLEIVPKNVAALVDPVRVERDRTDDTLTPEEIAQLLTSLANDRLVALADLAMHLGCRKGELLALHWTDLDLKTKQLRIGGTLKYLPGRGLVLDTPKTAAGERLIPLTERLIEVLRGHRAKQLKERLFAGELWEDSGFIFTTELGTPIDPRNLLRWWYSALANAGLERRTFHSTRRTAITHMAEAGVALEVAASIVGHASITTTADVYNRVRPRVQVDALERLERHLAP